jgi:hypothetical protein
MQQGLKIVWMLLRDFAYLQRRGLTGCGGGATLQQEKQPVESV